MTFNELVEKIAQFEGFVDHTYTDATGTKTIGYGFTNIKYTSQLTMTKKQAKDILYELTQQTFNNVKNKCVAWGYVFTDEQLYALTDFTYNCGINNLSLLTKDGKRTPTEIATHILQYNKSKGKVLKGLTTRRQWEQSLFCGSYSAMDIQMLCNTIILEMELNIEPLKIDGIIGTKSIDTIGKILSLIR